MIRLSARRVARLASGLTAIVMLAGSLPAAEPAPPAEDPSVVVAPKGPSLDVVNGSAYDRAEIDLGTNKQLIVPAAAEVVQEGTGTTLRLFTRKTLAFAGHPPEKMHILTARNNMGLATQTLADGLVIGTFGEFGTKEGGASLKLRLVVPQGITVERRADLSGDGSRVHSAPGVKLRDPKNGYWYGPTGPSDGWTIVKTTPDGERTLKK